MADNNLLITKIEEQGKTKTYVKNLENAEKINEVASAVTSVKDYLEDKPIKVLQKD